MDFTQNRSRAGSVRPGRHDRRRGLHTAAPTRTRRPRPALRSGAVAQADRRRHPERRRAGVGRRWRLRRPGAGRDPDGAGTAAGRGAVSGVGGARAPARWPGSARGAAAGVGGPRRCRREDRHRGPRRRAGARARCRPTKSDDGFRLTGPGPRSASARSPTHSWCRPRPIPGPRSSSSPPASRRHGDTAADHRAWAAPASSNWPASRSAPTASSVAPRCWTG